MKTLKAKITVKNTITTSITALFTTLFAWWGMHFPGPIPSSAKADTFPINCAIQASPSPTPITDNTPLPSLTCVPGPTAYPTPPQLESLPSLYQNPNGAQMVWLQYGGDSNQPKPGVLLIHGSNWNAGDAGDVLAQTQQIASAGFFAASVQYELAPNIDTAAGYIPGQPCHELDGTNPGDRMKLEVNDIKSYVRAMRADPRCLNGWVAVVGGSAGAAHAITVALDTNPTPGGAWPFWFQGGHDDRPDCAVMLSAIYDFSDWKPPTGLTQTDPEFVHFGMRNYAQVQNPIDQSTLANLPLNPINLIPGAIAHGFKPIYMINSYYDHPTAYHQLVGMICLLQSSGLTEGTDYQYLTIPGSLHSFHYWGSWDHLPGDPQHTVGDDVIAFLKAQAGLP